MTLPTEAYEKAFRDLLGAGEALSFWKGRVALYAALEGLGVGPGDEVVLPGYTCVVVPNAVLYRGARPIYVDVDAATFNATAEAIRQALTLRTRAIIIQHTYGIPSDMDGVLAVAREAGVPVIEDCCHALGSTYRGKPCGTFGHAAFFSFQWSKPYTTGLGGMALVNDAALAEKMRRIQASYAWPSARESGALTVQRSVYRHFFRPRLFWTAMDALRLLSRAGLFVGSSSQAELECRKPEGYEKRMGTAQARAGMRQLASVGAILRHRRETAGLYDSLLKKAGFPLLQVPPHADPALLRYPVLVRDKPAVLEEARRRHVEIGTWFECVLHPEGSPLAAAQYTPGQCPVGEHLAAHVINLPTHAAITQREAERTVAFLADLRDRGCA